MPSPSFGVDRSGPPAEVAADLAVRAEALAATEPRPRVLVRTFAEAATAEHLRHALADCSCSEPAAVRLDDRPRFLVVHESPACPAVGGPGLTIET